jgi:hypothetical protein
MPMKTLIKENQAQGAHLEKWIPPAMTSRRRSSSPFSDRVLTIEVWKMSCILTPTRLHRMRELTIPPKRPHRSHRFGADP